MHRSMTAVEAWLEGFAKKTPDAEVAKTLLAAGVTPARIRVARDEAMETALFGAKLPMPGEAVEGVPRTRGR